VRLHAAFALAFALALGIALPARAEDDTGAAAPESSEAPESPDATEPAPATELVPEAPPPPPPPPEAAAAVALARARLAVRRGDPDAARRILDDALTGAALDEMHSDLLAWRAALNVGAGDLGAAEKDLRRLLKLRPDDAAARRDLGIVRLARDKLMWATRDLAAAVEAAPEDARAQYALGLALLRGESFVEASAVLERAGSLAPELEPRIEYYRGLAAYREGDLESARKRFALVAGRPGAYGEVAEAFLDAVYREQGGQPLLSVHGAIGGQYDSNPVLDPEGSSVALGHHAAAITFRGGLALSPLPPGRHRLTGSADVTLTRYGDRSADDFDYTGLNGTVEYAYGFDIGSLANAVEAAYLWRLALLGGGPRAEENELYVFSESHAGRIGWRLAPGDWGVTRLTYELRGSYFAHLGRDSLGHHLALSQSVFLFERQLKLYLRFLARIDDAKAPGYDQWSVGPFLGISARPLWDVDLVAWVAYTHEVHPDSMEYWKSTEHRVDDAVRISFSLSRTFNDLFRLSLSWTHTEHPSTMAQFEYQRDVVQFSGGFSY